MTALFGLCIAFIVEMYTKKSIHESSLIVLLQLYFMLFNIDIQILCMQIYLIIIAVFNAFSMEIILN